MLILFSMIFLQGIIFVAMIFVLKRIMAKNVVSATKHIEELNQDYIKKEELVSRQIEEAKRESQDIVAKARQEAEALKARITKETDVERESLLAEARAKSGEIIEQADKARERLIMEIDKKVEHAAIDEAMELIHNTLPEKFRKDIHSQWVSDLVENGFGKVERLNIPKDIKEVKVTSAFALESNERKELLKKLKSILGYEAPIKEDVDPKIVAGIELRVGNLILDGSLRNKIKEQAKNAKHSGNE